MNLLSSVHNLKVKNYVNNGLGSSEAYLGNRKQIKETMAKYSTKGGFTKETFKNLGVANESMCIRLASKSNGSLATATWRKYGTATNHLDRASKELNMNFTFPFDVSMTLTFVGYLIKRGLQADTIESYLSGIRQAHITKGLLPHCLKPDFVKCVLTGLGNLGNSNNEKVERLPVTIEDLKSFRIELGKLNLPWQDKILLWTICTWCFAGSFRIHELLPVKETEYDPTTTLTHGDVRLTKVKHNSKIVEVLMVNIKNPKEGKGKSVVVELFANNTFWCPVKAYKKLIKTWGSKPKFNTIWAKRCDGRFLTGRYFNDVLKIISAKRALLRGGIFRSHSFRAGIPSLMARAGYPENEIQRQGRWRSSAFLVYCKMGRSARLKDQLELASRINELQLYN